MCNHKLPALLSPLVYSSQLSPWTPMSHGMSFVHSVHTQDIFKWATVLICVITSSQHNCHPDFQASQLVLIYCSSAQTLYLCPGTRYFPIQPSWRFWRLLYHKVYQAPSPKCLLVMMACVGYIALNHTPLLMCLAASHTAINPKSQNFDVLTAITPYLLHARSSYSHGLFPNFQNVPCVFISHWAFGAQWVAVKPSLAT